MKKIIVVSLLSVMMLAPLSVRAFNPAEINVANYTTVESKEALRVQLIALIKDLLQKRIALLLSTQQSNASLAQVLGVSTTTEVVKKKRRGGGGGGGSSRSKKKPEPEVVTPSPAAFTLATGSVEKSATTLEPNAGHYSVSFNAVTGDREVVIENVSYRIDGPEDAYIEDISAVDITPDTNGLDDDVLLLAAKATTKIELKTVVVTDTDGWHRLELLDITYRIAGATTTETIAFPQATELIYLASSIEAPEPVLPYSATLAFTESSNNPEATTIVVDKDTARTNGVEVLAYEIEAEGGDITLYELAATVSYAAGSASSSMDSIFDDVYLEIDGEKFRAEEDMSTTTGATGSDVFTFDIDGDIEIDEDDMVEVMLVVDLKGSDEGDNFPNGTQIEAEVDSTNVDATEAEGSDDVTELNGTASSETHTLVAEGIVVPADSFEYEVDTIDEGRVGVFDITIDVTAVEDTFYLDTDDVATWFTVEGGTGTTTVVVDSSADDDTDGIYEISEGSTESFTFTVIVDPAAAGSFRVVLDEVEYSTDETGVAAATTYTLSPASDYRTGYQALTN